LICSESVLTYVHFQEQRCNGCALCVKVCPTGAIRVKEGRSIFLVDRCIGCGECIRVCPTGAVVAATSEHQDIKNEQMPVALVTPTLYSQFPGVPPEKTHQGLLDMGFKHVVDMTGFIGLYQKAAEAFIEKNRKTHQNPGPLISSVCPVVIRLIAFHFPDLLPNILPLLRPVTLMAREVYKYICKEHENISDKVTFYYILPCPTKTLSAQITRKTPLPYKEKAIGINEIYVQLLNAIEQVQDIDLNHLNRISFGNCGSKDSLIWTMSGGEIAYMDIEKSMAVSGLKETLAYLQKIELGLLNHLEYIELRACQEGCIGGPLTAIDKYMAKHNVQKSLLSSGITRSTELSPLLKQYEQTDFDRDLRPERLKKLFGVSKSPLSIADLQKIESILRMTEHRDCSLCGAPDCKTFAEDVVRGRVSRNDCAVIQLKKIQGKLKKRNEN
jgi:iron only hydrogenase large subunit-like protein